MFWKMSVALVVLSLSPVVQAQTPACDALEGAEKATAADLLGRLKPYECCTDSFAKCLAAPKPCAIVTRLASELCRMVRLGKDAPSVERAYEKRERSMAPNAPVFTIGLDESARLGDPKAPVTLVVYACTRCPFCRDMVLALHREVTEDSLKGKVKVYLRPFPIKGHEGATEGATALLAAAKQDRMWPYAVYTYKHFEEFHASVLPDWAEFVKLDRAAFEKAMADEKIRDALTEIKKEGARNKIEATPSLFIDGRAWKGELEIGAVVDALLEEHERVTAKKP